MHFVTVKSYDAGAGSIGIDYSEPVPKVVEMWVESLVMERFQFEKLDQKTLININCMVNGFLRQLVTQESLVRHPLTQKWVTRKEGNYG